MNRSKRDGVGLNAIVVFVLLFPKLTKEQEKGLLEQKLKQMNQEESQPQKQ